MGKGNMTNINVAKNSSRHKFLESILGKEHMTSFHNGTEIVIYYLTGEDKKVVEEMEKETLVR